MILEDFNSIQSISGQVIEGVDQFRVDMTYARLGGGAPYCSPLTYCLSYIYTSESSFVLLVRLRRFSTSSQFLFFFFSLYIVQQRDRLVFEIARHSNHQQADQIIVISAGLLVVSHQLRCSDLFWRVRPRQRKLYAYTIEDASLAPILIADSSDCASLSRLR